MTDQQTDLRRHEQGYDADEYQTGYGDDGYPEGHPNGDADGYHEAAIEEPLDDWDADEWDADEWDVDDWDGAPTRRTTPPAVSHPWYRDPRWLFGLIALAAVALVVATVLLVTGRDSGEIPTTPELTTRTPASSTSAPTPRSSARSPSTSASESTASTSAPASSTAEETGAVDVAPPVEPTASATEPPAPPAPSHSPAGPRINVTRNPMSFSPGKH